LGISITVKNIQSKNIAIGTLEKIVFGDKRTNIDGLNIQEISLPRNANIKISLSEILKQPRSHISNLIKSSAVKINDNPIDNHIVEVEQGDVLQVGKKVKFKVVIDED
jgi:RNA-binding protein YlmH